MIGPIPHRAALRRQRLELPRGAFQIPLTIPCKRANDQMLYQSTSKDRTNDALHGTIRHALPLVVVLVAYVLRRTAG